MRLECSTKTESETVDYSMERSRSTMFATLGPRGMNSHGNVGGVLESASEGLVRPMAHGAYSAQRGDIQDEATVAEVVRVGRDLHTRLGVLSLADVERPQKARNVDEERLVREVVARADPGRRGAHECGRECVLTQQNAWMKTYRLPKPYVTWPMLCVSGGAISFLPDSSRKRSGRKTSKSGKTFGSL